MGNDHQWPRDEDGIHFSGPQRSTLMKPKQLETLGVHPIPSPGLWSCMHLLWVMAGPAQLQASGLWQTPWRGKGKPPISDLITCPAFAGVISNPSFPHCAGSDSLCYISLGDSICVISSAAAAFWVFHPGRARRAEPAGSCALGRVSQRRGSASGLAAWPRCV